MEQKEKDLLKTGVAVFILLALVTAGEFFIGSIAQAWIAPLIFAAILKAFFIVRDYMHIGRVFETDEEEQA